MRLQRKRLEDTEKEENSKYMMKGMSIFAYITHTTGRLPLLTALMLVTLVSKAELLKIGNVYCIHNASELNEFGTIVAKGDTTANGMLMNDIDFKDWTSWEPIGGR